MDIFECERIAQQTPRDMQFYAHFPAGKTLCSWLDPYMGCVKVHTPELEDGFLMTRQIAEMFPGLECELIGEPS